MGHHRAARETAKYGSTISQWPGKGKYSGAGGIRGAGTHGGGAGRKRPRQKIASPTNTASGDVVPGGEPSEGVDDDYEAFLVAEYESGEEGLRGSGGGRESSDDDEDGDSKRKTAWGEEEEGEWDDLGLRQARELSCFW